MFGDEIMQYRKILLISSAIVLAACVSGCKPKEIVVNQSAAALPVIEKKSDIELDYFQMMEDTKALMEEQGFDQIYDMDFCEYPDDNVTEITLMVKPEVSQVDAMDYAEAFIRAFNDAAATQDFSYKVSDEHYHGGYWDKWGMDLMVFWMADFDKPEEYLINQVMDPGAQDPVIPQVRASVQESLDAESEKAEQ